ncbi:MprA protease, GlyGly-CTERM protein-sorting domain-containing form [Akkermansiaceae bacterium]|nr:MprA protease, GlyGly-CTERM protein-sorting domain-containing form [Akkermansiaceae bacterium]MDB4288626.1 MprA protease, GlyGly-CTERM protein-sorting domain-containing form [bacterium]MDB4296853.1 MprA protease, GlyGly-CTERM protein-sorting domain-containing form [Akkermansiaceae bacterium]MDB4329080.1 MprA protease, GlyGly-CTERM protein-sorting domain-containing form [Akkermansiaceae bacterium]MDB4393215.1 MprA protease, GlyGly-CTERM protein-sorting domain-containing form [Akkermansiaceae 
MKTLSPLLGLVPFLILPTSAAIIWTGATSTDVFDESNWDLSGSAVTVIDSNISVADDLTITGATASIPDLPGQIRFQVGDGFTINLNNATLESAGNDGVGGAPAGAGMMINVTNGSQLNTFFVLNGADVQVDGTSSVTLGGGGNPVNLSTINLTSGSVLSFMGETPAAFTTEHLSKITVDGAAAVDGVNINIANFNGASGSQVTVIPEPSHALLLGISGLLGFARRRRS